MGSSAPKSETVVKGGKPTIVREWLSPEYLKELSGLAKYYGDRALQERSTYQNMVNTQRISQGEVPLFPTMQTTAGRVIQPGLVAEPYDTSKLVEAAEEGGMFQLPKSTGGRRKEQNPRESYGNALGMMMKSNQMSDFERNLQS